jgi:hypothetical protein
VASGGRLLSVSDIVTLFRMQTSNDEESSEGLSPMKQIQRPCVAPDLRAIKN